MANFLELDIFGSFFITPYRLKRLVLYALISSLYNSQFVHSLHIARRPFFQFKQRQSLQIIDRELQVFANDSLEVYGLVHNQGSLSVSRAPKNEIDCRILVFWDLTTHIVPDIHPNYQVRNICRFHFRKKTRKFFFQSMDFPQKKNCFLCKYPLMESILV